MALATGVAVRATWAAERAATAWGERRPTVVVSSEVPAGRPIGDTDVERRLLPRTLVPEGAATDPGDVVGRAAVVDLVPGEVLLRRRVAPGDVVGPAARLTPGERAVAVPVGDDEPFVAPGQRVDLVTVAAPTADAGTASEVVVADVEVLEVGPGTVLVAVEATAVARLASATATGPLLLAVRGGLSDR